MLAKYQIPVRKATPPSLKPHKLLLEEFSLTLLALETLPGLRLALRWKSRLQKVLCVILFYRYYIEMHLDSKESSTIL